MEQRAMLLQEEHTWAAAFASAAAAGHCCCCCCCCYAGLSARPRGRAAWGWQQETPESASFVVWLVAAGDVGVVAATAAVAAPVAAPVAAAACGCAAKSSNSKSQEGIQAEGDPRERLSISANRPMGREGGFCSGGCCSRCYCSGSQPQIRRSSKRPALSAGRSIPSSFI